MHGRPAPALLGRGLAEGFDGNEQPLALIGHGPERVGALVQWSPAPSELLLCAEPRRRWASGHLESREATRQLLPVSALSCFCAQSLETRQASAWPPAKPRRHAAAACLALPRPWGAPQPSPRAGIPELGIFKLDVAAGDGLHLEFHLEPTSKAGFVEARQCATRCSSTVTSDWHPRAGYLLSSAAPPAMAALRPSASQGWASWSSTAPPAMRYPRAENLGARQCRQP